MIRDYLGATERVTDGIYGQYRVRKDWSYCNTRFWRPGLVLLGDAACFVDPLFSSGIHLATYSALLAGRSINTFLRGSISEQRCFDEFEERYRCEYLTFLRFLSVFYDKSKEKEAYFRAAHEILETDETDRQAFVRLVSGFSTGGDIGERPGSEGSGRSVARSALDIFMLGRTGKALPIPSPNDSTLVPSVDGLHWTEANTRKNQLRDLTNGYFDGSR
jgi:hypothetical protein